MILSTAEAFEPEASIVNKEPLGMKGEVVPTLRFLRQECPGTRIVLGLRDVMDDPGSVYQSHAGGAPRSRPASLYPDLSRSRCRTKGFISGASPRRRASSSAMATERWRPPVQPMPMVK